MRLQKGKFYKCGSTKRQLSKKQNVLYGVMEGISIVCISCVGYIED